MLSLMAPKRLVTGVKLSTVKPRQLTSHTRTIDYNYQDLFLTDCYIPTIYAYRLAENSTEYYARFVNRVKESLEKVLVPFFPYAGRSMPHEEHGRQLTCSDEGVPFAEGYVDKNLDSVVQASGGFQPVIELNGYDIFELDPAQLWQKMKPGGLPSLFVLVTRFKCGGVVLGVTFNHMLCDGEAFFMFMSAWSEMGRTNTLSVQPDIDRSKSITFEAVVDQLGGKDTTDPFVKNMLDLKSPLASHTMPKTWVTRTYEVNASTVWDMKREAQGSEGGQYISTNDCILAQFSKFTSSIPPSVTDKKPVIVASMVEGRKRWLDVPSPNLLGNSVLPLAYLRPPPEILSEPAYQVAQKLRINLNQKDWKEFLGLESFMGIKEGFVQSTIRSFGLTSWAKYPLYEIDFGVGGRPFFAIGINQTFNWGVSALACSNPPIPSNPNSAGTLLITSFPEILDSVEAAPGFASFILKHEQQPKASDRVRSFGEWLSTTLSSCSCCRARDRSRV